MFFFFQAEDGIRDIGVTGVQTCALPISTPIGDEVAPASEKELQFGESFLSGQELAKIAPHAGLIGDDVGVFGIGFRLPTVSVAGAVHGDRKSTRLNSSHANISYAVFCLKKKKHIVH